MRRNATIPYRKQNKAKNRKNRTKLGKQEVDLKRRGLGDEGRQDDGGDIDKAIVCMKL